MAPSQMLWRQDLCHSTPRQWTSTVHPGVLMMMVRLWMDLDLSLGELLRKGPSRVKYITKARHKKINILLQAGMVLAVSTSGPVAMVASLRTTATVMATLPVSLLSVSAVPVRMVTSLGILNSAAPP